MNAPTASELESFHRFVSEKLVTGAAELSPEEALDLWRAENPASTELAESIAAVRVALADMKAGDSGKPLEHFAEEFRARHQVPRR